jgi:hypothetical protein
MQVKNTSAVQVYLYTLKKAQCCPRIVKITKIKILPKRMTSNYMAIPQIPTKFRKSLIHGNDLLDENGLVSM